MTVRRADFYTLMGQKASANPSSQALRSKKEVLMVPKKEIPGGTQFTEGKNEVGSVRLSGTKEPA
jgi:hypothetical protein